MLIKRIIPSNMSSIVFEILLTSAKQKEKNSFLDLIVTENTGSKTLCKKIEDVLLLAQFPDISQIRIGNDFLCNPSSRFARQQNNIIRKNKGSKSRRRRRSIPIPQRSICSHELDSVSRFNFINQIIIHNHIHRPRKLSRRSPFWHLLNRNRLMITIRRIPKLNRQGMALSIFFRICTPCRSSRSKGSSVAVLHGMMHFCVFAVMD